MKKPTDRIGMARMGPYSSLARSLADSLGWDLVLPDHVYRRDIEVGASQLNELMCLPAKSTLGTMIRECEMGATKLVQFNSCGQCRLKAYWILQQRALRRLGYDATVYPVTLGRRTVSDLRRIDPSLSRWKAWRGFIAFLREVGRMDREARQSEGGGDVNVGVVGEIYTLHESAVNANLFHKLNRLGVNVHNSLPLSYFVFKRLYDRGWMKRPGMDVDKLKQAHKVADDYFPLADFGGHGREAIIHSIYYALAGFDGVIHVLPFPCSPEAAIASVLDDISRDFGMPMLRLIFDAQTGEAGIVTRLEAFVDMIRKKRGYPR